MIHRLFTVEENPRLCRWSDGRASLHGLRVSGGTVFPFCEHSISVARRFSRVSSRFAVITQKLTAFGNVTFGTAQGRGISSAQYLFTPADLANQAWQTLDHAQTWTANAGLAYREGGTLVSALLGYGSGLRTGADNASHVPGWVRVDLTLAHDFLNLPLKPTLAIDVVNLFDAVYAYRLYNGFNGSHWAPGRARRSSFNRPRRPRGFPAVSAYRSRLDRCAPWKSSTRMSTASWAGASPRSCSSRIPRHPGSGGRSATSRRLTT